MFVAQQQSNWEEALRAAQLAPQSRRTYMAALNAFRVGRFRQALRELDELDATRGWARGSALPLSLRMNLLHHIGDYAGQLSVARRARKDVSDRYPRRLSADRNELTALVALGRLTELERRFEIIARSATAFDTSIAMELYATVGSELRAHGAPALAQKYFEECVELSENEACLNELGRYAEVLERFSTDTLAFETVSVAAAQLGMRDEAKRFLNAFRIKSDAWGPAWSYGMRFAEARVAALLAERQRALELLLSEPQQGRVRELLHDSGSEFSSIRDDPAIVRLLQSPE